MNAQIVELAAWIIVGKFCFDAFVPDWKKRKDDRRRSLEAEAVHAEYHDSRISTQRQNDLLLRYPQYLVSAPGSRFMQEAIDTQKRVDHGRREAWSEIARVAPTVWFVLGLIVLIGWAAFSVLSGSVEFQHLTTTLPGVAIGLLINLWAAYHLFRLWKVRSALGKLAALFVGLSLIFGVWAFLGVCGVASPRTMEVQGPTAAILFAFGFACAAMGSKRS
jgi:hypothetical protein